MNELRDHRREARRGTTEQRRDSSQSNKETGSWHSGPCGAACDSFPMPVASGTGFAFFRDRCSDSHGSFPPWEQPVLASSGPSSLGAPAHPTHATDDKITAHVSTSRPQDPPTWGPRPRSIPRPKLLQIPIPWGSPAPRGGAGDPSDQERWTARARLWLGYRRVRYVAFRCAPAARQRGL